jgi:hypothetical protein
MNGPKFATEPSENKIQQKQIQTLKQQKMSENNCPTPTEQAEMQTTEASSTENSTKSGESQEQEMTTATITMQTPKKTNQPTKSNKRTVKAADKKKSQAKTGQINNFPPPNSNSTSEQEFLEPTTDHRQEDPEEEQERMQNAYANGPTLDHDYPVHPEYDPFEVLLHCHKISNEKIMFYSAFNVVTSGGGIPLPEVNIARYMDQSVKN